MIVCNIKGLGHQVQIYKKKKIVICCELLSRKHPSVDDFRVNPHTFKSTEIIQKDGVFHNYTNIMHVLFSLSFIVYKNKIQK